MDSKRESVLVTQCTWNSCLRSQSWSQQGGRTEKLRFLKLNVSWTFLNKVNPEVLIAQTCILGDDTNSSGTSGVGFEEALDSNLLPNAV